MSNKDEEAPNPQEEEDKTSENDSGDKTPSNEDSGDTTENNQEDLNSAIAQKKHWREKAEELKKERDELKKKAESSGDKDTSKESPKGDTSSDDVSKVLEITTATKDLNDDEIEELQLRAKSKGVSLTEARKDEVFQTWLEAKREKVKKENKTPEPSTKQSPSPKSPEDVKNPSELVGLSREEKIDYFNSIGAGGIMKRLKKKGQES